MYEDQISKLQQLKNELSEYTDVDWDENIASLIKDVELRLSVLEACSEFKIPVPKYTSSAGYFNLHLFPHIVVNVNFITFTEASGREISWPDDGRQPEDGEQLVQISFPTGAYSMDSGYPTESFNAMFNELKSFGYKYIDTANKSLYCGKETAHIVLENLEQIFFKHKEKIAEEYKRKQIQELKNKLEELEGK